jgi:predicted RNA-binding protein with PIN domain
VLVDGYNIIFAWESLKTLAAQSLDAARDRLIDIMRNYQSFRQCPVILVFDAYKVKGNPGSVTQFGDLSVVYTKEAQTADSYIERLSYDLAKKHRVRVATSDGLEQIIILGHGALRVSARAFELEVNGVMESIRSFLSE